MAIKNTVSILFLSTLLDSIDVLELPPTWCDNAGTKFENPLLQILVGALGIKCLICFIKQ